MKLPAALESAMAAFTHLPGIGRKAAERMTLYLLDAPPNQATELAQALLRLRTEVRPCSICGVWAEEECCVICQAPARMNGQLCVVEQVPDVWAFESASAFEGRYHVLGGTLSPLSGITAEDLNIAALEARIAQEHIQEVVIATNPSLEGDATAFYLLRRLEPLNVEMTRIASGVPMGGRLGYSDAGTLRLALEGRRKMGT